MSVVILNVEEPQCNELPLRRTCNIELGEVKALSRDKVTLAYLSEASVTKAKAFLRLRPEIEKRILLTFALVIG